MNPAFKPEALEMFVGEKTEDHFNDDFWTSLDGVCNALDNMEARFYVDKCCVKYVAPTAHHPPLSAHRSSRHDATRCPSSRRHRF